jgi:phospholipid/cholesterol/gamma-HCH transport system substrate-binding protein
MRREGVNYLAVGAFVVAMVVALVVWIGLMSGRTGPSDHYYVVYRNVMGLKTGVEILYEGYPVGRIERIERSERDGRTCYRVDVTVRRGWPVPDDSLAVIRAPGLLASVVIDIQAGTSSQLLAPGSEIPGGEATDLVAAVNEVTSRVVSIIDKTIEPALMDISRGTPEIIENLEASVRQINELLTPHNVERVGRILANVETATDNANAVLADLSETRHRVDELIERTGKLLNEDDGEVGSALTNLNHSLAAVARHIDAISANLENTTRNMNEFSRQIRENPSALVRGREAPSDAP